MIRICLVPKLNGVGGMVSFQHKLAAGLLRRGVEVCYDLGDRPYDAVLVIGGIRQLRGLWQARRRGVPVVQRLDGMNWIHRVRRTGLRHALRAEYGNFILALIRSRLALRIVYQSEFARRWWEDVRGPAPGRWSVVYNGVDLEVYTPHGPAQRPDSDYRVLLVEGSLMGGYEMGLEAAVELTCGLAERQQTAYRQTRPGKVELLVVGRVPETVQRSWQQRLAQDGRASIVSLHWAGLAPRERIPEIDRSAHLLYSSDVNPACPNSVIEGLACGLPVAAFDTGALSELVTGDAGRIAPYGGDPWRLERPNIPALVQAASEILEDQPRFRAAARARAETAFGLDQMVDGYLEALLA